MHYAIKRFKLIRAKYVKKLLKYGVRIANSFPDPRLAKGCDLLHEKNYEPIRHKSRYERLSVTGSFYV